MINVIGNYIGMNKRGTSNDSKLIPIRPINYRISIFSIHWLAIKSHSADASEVNRLLHRRLEVVTPVIRNRPL